MEFKDYYATLGVEPTATPEALKRAYRKLARKYHPDVSKEPNAEARFKEVAEAHEALSDPERRAAYDDIAQRHARGQPFDPPPGWDTGFEFSGPGPGQGARRGPQPFDNPGEAGDFSAFFESLFGQGRGPAAGMHRAERGRPAARGSDHHAKVAIGLLEAYQGATRAISLRMPVADGAGHSALQTRQLEVTIPAGVRQGQQLRLAGQGGPGQAGGPAGDLYLAIEILPHPVFRLEGGDIHFDLPVAPWEAALGATVTAPTPDGSVSLGVPAGSVQGRRLRLKGKGLPGPRPGDLYAVLSISLPPALGPAEQGAYTAFAAAFAGFEPRAGVLAMAATGLPVA